MKKKNKTPQIISAIKLFYCVCTIFIVTGCGDGVPQYANEPVIKKDTTKRIEKDNQLFAFVGEKISLIQLPHVEGSLDNAFIAKYKILTRVYGYYQYDTIEFHVYDHYGTPAFTQFRHVLLYLTNKDSDHYYHIKYVYDDVYVTKDDRWAGRITNSYENLIDTTRGMKPEKINFKYDINFTIRDDDEDKGISYKEPYFEIKGRVAKAIYGNYIEDLFRLKQYGSLTARGFFGDTLYTYPNVPIELEVQDVEMAPATSK